MTNRDVALSSAMVAFGDGLGNMGSMSVAWVWWALVFATVALAAVAGGMMLLGWILLRPWMSAWRFQRELDRLDAEEIRNTDLPPVGHEAGGHGRKVPSIR